MEMSSTGSGIQVIKKCLLNNQVWDTYTFTHKQWGFHSNLIKDAYLLAL